MLRKGVLISGVIIAVAAMSPFGAMAATASAAKPAAASQPPPYSRKGADTCLRCHDSAKVKSIFKSKHAVSADKRTPFAHLQCETCHGPGGTHAQRLHPGEARPPIPMFGKNSTDTVPQENAVCLSCHQDSHRVGWQGSVHQRQGVACVSCHTIHATRDPVFTKATQPDICYKCHQRVRSEFYETSSHPVRFGEMGCTDCHQPHDSLNPKLLTKATVNQTCYTCHAEKRGPFLWEHPPVAENCVLCHRPHGSVHMSLLTMRAPLLCQQCHSAAGHPSVAYTAAGLPNNQPSGFILGGSCLNCHSQVHGSNNPSGADLNR